MPSPMPQLPPNLPPNEDRGDAAIVVFWVLSGIATLIVAARFYARWLIAGIRLDDWMILVSLGLLFVTSGFITHIAKLGGFRHLVFVPLENASEVARSVLLAQVFNITAFGTSKFAVGYQLLRVLERTAAWRKALVWTIMVVTLVYNVIEGVLMMFQCKPVRTAWDPFTPGECWSTNTKLVNIYVGGVYNIIIDVVLALLPLPTIWHLQISLSNRIRLCFLLALGLFAAVSSCVKLSYADTIKNVQDLTWGTYELDVWSGAEVFVIIVCASIPPLHVFWQRIVTEKTYGKGSSLSYGNASSKRNSKVPGSVGHRLNGYHSQPSTPAARGTSSEDDEAKLWPKTSHFSITSEHEQLHMGRGIAATTEISVSSSNDRMRGGQAL